MEQTAVNFRTLLRKRNHIKEFGSFAKTLSLTQWKNVVRDADEAIGQIEVVREKVKNGDLKGLAEYLESLSPDVLKTFLEPETIVGGRSG